MSGPQEWTPDAPGRCIGAQHCPDRGPVCCGGPDRLACGVGTVRRPRGWLDLWGGWHPTLRRAVAADWRNLRSTIGRRR